MRFAMLAVLFLSACATAKQAAPLATAGTAHTRTCAGGAPTPRGNLKLQHKMLWLEGGALVTTCSVSTLERRSSAVDFWLPSEDGHAVASCAVTEDVEGEPSGGVWVFNNQGEQSAVGYVDPERAMLSPLKMQCVDGGAK
jgi:streptogramin lyase